MPLAKRMPNFSHHVTSVYCSTDCPCAFMTSPPRSSRSRIIGVRNSNRGSNPKIVIGVGLQRYTTSTRRRIMVNMEVDRYGSRLIIADLVLGCQGCTTVTPGKFGVLSATNLLYLSADGAIKATSSPLFARC